MLAFILIYPSNPGLGLPGGKVGNIASNLPPVSKTAPGTWGQSLKDTSQSQAWAGNPCYVDTQTYKEVKGVWEHATHTHCTRYQWYHLGQSWPKSEYSLIYTQTYLFLPQDLCTWYFLFLEELFPMTVVWLCPSCYSNVDFNIFFRKTFHYYNYSVIVLYCS